MSYDIFSTSKLKNNYISRKILIINEIYKTRKIEYNTKVETSILLKYTQ